MEASAEDPRPLIVNKFLDRIGPNTVVLCVAAAFLCCYLISPSENFAYADDSLHYVNNVAHGGAWKVHHLIQVVLAHAFRLVPLEMESGFHKSLVLMRIYVALCSFLALMVVGNLMLRWRYGIGAAVGAMLFVACSYGYWAYSIVPDLYVPSIAFTLLAIWFAEKACCDERPAGGYGSITLSALSILVAALNHQLQALVVVPITLVMLLVRHGGRRVESARRAAVFFAIVGIMGFSVFYWFYKLSAHDNFLLFVRGMSAYMERPSQDHLQPLTPVYAAVGLTRTIVYPEYVLGFDGIYEAVQRQFPLKFLVDERYIIRDTGTIWLGVLTALNVLLLGGLAFLSVLGARSIKRARPQAPGYWMVVLWACSMAAVSVLWEPTSNEFWIWAMPALALVLTPLIAGKEKRWTFALVFFLAALLVANAPIMWRYRSAAHCIYRVNKTYLERLTGSDLAIEAGYQNSNAAGLLVRSPATRHFCTLGAFSLQDSLLMEELRQTAERGGRVIVDPMLMMPTNVECSYMEFAIRGSRRTQVADALGQLENYCESQHIPLYGVVRQGVDVVPFERRRFHGYLTDVQPDAL